MTASVFTPWRYAVCHAHLPSSCAQPLARHREVAGAGCGGEQLFISTISRPTTLIYMAILSGRSVEFGGARSGSRRAAAKG